MSVNCSATMMGSNDRKLKAGSSSSKPLSSCVAKGQPMCSPKENKKKIYFSHSWLHLSSTLTQLLHFFWANTFFVLYSNKYLSIWTETEHLEPPEMCTAFNWFILTLQVFITVGPPFWYVKGVPACSGVPLLSCLHTIRIRLTLLSSVEVGQQVAGTALQVRAREVEVKVSEELM